MNARPINAAPPAIAAPDAPRTRLAPASRPALSLRIHRIVLEGFAFGARDRGRLQAALQTELTQLLLAHGLGPTLLGDAAVPSLHAGEVRLDGERDVARLGRAIARSLYAGFAS